jgi:leucine dehydrogenase
VQGAGKVAHYLMQHLHAENARIIVTDIEAEKVKRAVQEFGAEAVAPTAIYDQAADIYAPCALGATVNDETLPRLKVQVIAGGANNQLGVPEDAERLHARGILYAPDYVINAGGAMALIGIETLGWSYGQAEQKVVAGVQGALHRIFDIADAEGITTEAAARRLAQERLQAVD